MTPRQFTLALSGTRMPPDKGSAKAARTVIVIAASYLAILAPFLAYI